MSTYRGHRKDSFSDLFDFSEDDGSSNTDGQSFFDDYGGSFNWASFGACSRTIFSSDRVVPTGTVLFWTITL